LGRVKRPQGAKEVPKLVVSAHAQILRGKFFVSSVAVDDGNRALFADVLVIFEAVVLRVGAVHCGFAFMMVADLFVVDDQIVSLFGISGAVADSDTEGKEFDFGFLDIFRETLGGAFGIDADIFSQTFFRHVVKTIEDALPDFIDYIRDGYPGTFIAEPGAAFVPGPGGIEGADALAEVGECTFGGDVFINAGNVPIIASPFLVPEYRKKGVHVWMAVHMRNKSRRKSVTES
jgi:hypothetical protein